MIARLWHGRIRRELRDAYAKYTTEHGIADYKAVPGNTGAFLLMHDQGAVTHVLTLSFWESLDSIRSFAGDEYECARYYPQDAHYLLEFEPLVEHYEILE